MVCTAEKILLSVNGEKLPVPSNYSPSTRLIDVLRGETRFKGSKVGCGEGGCGACTVIVDRLDAATGALSRVTLNSCLATVGSLDGAAVTTAEGLGNSKIGFNAAQEAMAKRFGSQCGFCSPGMVVAMTAAAAAESSGADQSRAASVARGLDGNLCRCTGWRPIIDACRDIADMEDLHKQSCTAATGNAEHASSNGSAVKGSAILPPPEASFPDWLRQYVISKHRLQQQQQQQQQQVWLSSSGSGGSSDQIWVKPGSLRGVAAAVSAAAERGWCPKLLAGNTGSGVYKDLWPHDRFVVDLSTVKELHQITHHHHRQGVIIGAGVTIQQLIHLLRTPAAENRKQQAVGHVGGRCAVQHHSSSSRCVNGGHQCQGNGHCAGSNSYARLGVIAEECDAVAGAPSTTKDAWSAIADHLERIAGVHVRSAATLGGHFGLCARKPLQSDLALLLAAAGAQLQIMTVRGPCAGELLHSEYSSSQPHWQQQQQHGNWVGQGQQGWQQQCTEQQQRHDLRWVSVEDYLASSCLGGGSSTSSICEITPDSVAGASVVDVTSSQQQLQQEPWNVSGSSSASARLPEVVTAVWLPYADDGSDRFWSYKVALRHVNSHALVNAALWIKFDQSATALTTHGSSSTGSCSSGDGDLQQITTPADPRFTGARILSARLFVGLPPATDSSTAQSNSSAADGAAAAGSVSSGSSSGIEGGHHDEAWRITRVREVEKVLCGQAVDIQVTISCLRKLEDHLTSVANRPPTDYHSQALQGILYKALAPLIPNPSPDTSLTSHKPFNNNPSSLNPAPSPTLNPRVQRLLVLPKPYDPRVLPEGRQVLPGFAEQSSGVAPVHLPVEKEDVRLQCSGEAVFAGDVAAGMTGRLLYLAGVKSTRALAKISGIDTSGTAAVAGVVGVITAADIPGDNKAYTEPLLADGKVEYVGQVIALVAATSQAAADQAAAAVRVTYTPVPDHTPVITIDDAIAAGSFHADFPQLHAAAVRVERLAALGLTIPTHFGTSNTTSSSSGGSSDCDDSASSVASHHSSGICDGQLDHQLDQQMAKALVHQIIMSSPHQITNGSYSLPTQQHMYMETQTAVAEPLEEGGVRVTSSTQSLDAVQQVVAGVLDIPFNKVTVVAKRLGGAFGGKVSRSMPVAAAAALAASHFGKPVCYSLNRNDDLLINHGRCLGRLNYDVGFDDTGKVHAIKAQVIFRAGVYADLSLNDGGTLVSAVDSAYDLSGLAVDVEYARCNVPPHTIVRAPGFLQGVMVLEQVMEHVAAVLGMDSAAVKAANFLPDVDPSSSGINTITSNAGRLCFASPAAADLKQQQLLLQQRRDNKQPVGVKTVLGRLISSDMYTLPLLWQQLLSSSQYSTRLAAVAQYNSDHAWSKRGIVVTPVRFDCAPAAVSAAVSIYADGSVLVTHGGIEMGQGLTTKVKQAAVAALSQLLPEEQRPLPLDLVRVAASNSDVVPNGGPTWSSTGSEGNCQAVMKAGAKLVKQLKSYVKVHEDGLSTWKGTIAALYPDAVGFAPANAMLSAYGYFDGSIGRGSAKQSVQYSAFGAAVTEVELDVLTGERRVLSSHIKYDCGYPLNPAIDLGQIEGAFVMGLGAMLSEEVVVDEETGATISASTWKYKIPTMDLIPQQFTVEFGDWANPRGIMSSKASGEPAVMASTSALMALQQAVRAAVHELHGLQRGAAFADSSGGNLAGDSNGFRVLIAPATPCKVKSTVGAFRLADALEAALLQV